jgi:hypothetical protein
MLEEYKEILFPAKDEVRGNGTVCFMTSIFVFYVSCQHDVRRAKDKLRWAGNIARSGKRRSGFRVLEEEVLV